VLHLVVNIASD